VTIEGIAFAMRPVSLQSTAGEEIAPAASSGSFVDGPKRAVLGGQLPEVQVCDSCQPADIVSLTSAFSTPQSARSSFDLASLASASAKRGMFMASSGKMGRASRR
jgi:hypothetical protein